MAGSFKVDIAALQQLLPLSSGSEGENARERMFKELVVRSNCLIQLGQTAAAKGRSRAWNGTLSLESLRPLLLKCLGSAILQGENHFLELVNHAFTISRESLEPVSAGEQECVDLNQWHVLVFALVMQAALASAAQWKCQKGWVLDPEAFAGLCQHISTTRLTDFPTPQDVSETLSDWAADVSDAMRFFGETDGTIHFDSFSKWFVTRQLPSWHAGDVELQSRKRAFQLLKLMNNTPSLPNSVPGKLTPRGPGVALMLKTLPPSQWQSTSRRFFSDSATVFQPGQFML